MGVGVQTGLAYLVQLFSICMHDYQPSRLRICVTEPPASLR